MADTLAINVTRAATPTPAVYTVPGAVEVEPLSAFAHFDGTAAATSFRPALTFYSDAGLILARVFPGDSVAAGGTADVTFAPFLGSAATSTAATPVAAFGSFAPAATFVLITSTNPAAGDALVSSTSFTADGVSSYRVDVAFAASEVARTGGVGDIGILFHALRNSTELGIVGDINLPENADTIVIPTFLSFIDLPPAGTVIYNITGVKASNGTITAATRVYGDGLTPPVVGTTHPGYIAVYNLGAI